jgi:predicted permease
MMDVPLGDVIYSAVKPMIRMYMIIGTGFFMTKKGLFGITAARACSDMVLMLFMPALVFDKVVSYIDISDIKTIGVICFCAFIMYSINACVALLIVKFTPIPKTPKDRWVGGAILAGIMQNVSDLPIAYIQALSVFSLQQQNKGTAYVIIWLAMYVVVQFNCGLFQLVEWDFKFTEEHFYAKLTSNKSSEIDLEKHDDESNDSSTLSKHGNNDNNKDNDDNNIDNENNNNNYNTPKIYVSPTQHSYTSDSPISPTSSILSGDSILDDGSNMNEQSSRRFSNNLHPKPLTLITSRLSQLSRTTTRNNPIVRIPSARSVNYDPSNQLEPDTVSLNQELIREYSHVEPYNQKMSKVMRIVTETNLTIKDINESGNKIPFIKKYHLHYIVFFLQNFKKPNSIALVVSLTIALIPWTKALFVNNGTVILPNAPDHQPALSFILMYAEYLGYPCVPLGLLLIGSILARLEIKDIPKGFWKSAFCTTTFRLAILPIIGTAFITRLRNIGWLSDPMAMFVCTMEFALPSATVQIYLTAGAMRPEDKTCTPLNCFGLYLVLQYIVLVISMPIVVCYCIKNVVDM